MFDERSGKWIKIYKGLTIALFWLFIIFGILAGIEYSYDELFGFISGALAGCFVGYIQLVINMMIIQFFNNVQIIREKIESR